MFGEDDISFSKKYDITILSKNKGDLLLQKNKQKDENYCIISKKDIIPRKYGIFVDRKIKEGKLVSLM